MDLSKIDLNLFTVFDAIYQEGGITPASKRLHLSQPAVSHALARLRDLLNDPLFERVGNQMIPTPRARALATPIGGSLESIQQILHRAAQFDAASSRRRFVVAMREGQEFHFLPRIMRIMQREAPHAEVATVRIERRDIEEDLQSGALDCAIDMALPPSSAIRNKLLWSEPLVVLARKQHPLIGEQLDLDTYLRLDHVLVTGRRRGEGFIDAVLNRRGLARRIRVRCQQYAAAGEVVAQSDIVATLPRGYAEFANRSGSNRILPFPDDIPAFDVFMYWHANVDDDPAGLWFRERAAQALGNEAL